MVRWRQLGAQPAHAAPVSEALAATNLRSRHAVPRRAPQLYALCTEARFAGLSWLTSWCCAVRDLAPSALAHIAAHLSLAELGRLRSTCSALRFDPAILERAQRATLTTSLSQGTVQRFLPQLTQLRRLSLASVTSVFGIHQLSSQTLRKIVIAGIDVLDLHPLHVLSSLRVLALHDCRTHVGLPGLSLTKLRLSHSASNDCTAAGPLQVLEMCTLEKLEPLVQLTRLRFHVMEEQHSVLSARDAFKALAQLSRLRVLTLAVGSSADFQVCRLKQLEQLTLTNCIREPARLVPMLSGLSSLRRLALLQAPLTLPPLSLPSLAELLLLYDQVVGGKSSLPSLRSCSRLQQLHLRIRFGHGSLAVSSAVLPSHSITVLHSVSGGRLWINSAVAARCVLVATTPTKWHKFPEDA